MWDTDWLIQAARVAGKARSVLRDLVIVISGTAVLVVLAWKWAPEIVAWTATAALGIELVVFLWLYVYLAIKNPDKLRSGSFELAREAIQVLAGTGDIDSSSVLLQTMEVGDTKEAKLTVYASSESAIEDQSDDSE